MFPLPHRHEHLYEGIEDDLIQTDDFGHGFDPKNCIGTTKVVLCTLSMLSNPALYETGIFKYLPVERLVVDEASQIDTFEFMVSRSSSSLCRRAVATEEGCWRSICFTIFRRWRRCACSETRSSVSPPCLSGDYMRSNKQ